MQKYLMIEIEMGFKEYSVAFIEGIFDFLEFIEQNKNINDYENQFYQSKNQTEPVNIQQDQE